MVKEERAAADCEEEGGVKEDWMEVIWHNDTRKEEDRQVQRRGGLRKRGTVNERQRRLKALCVPVS